mgnify:CR=1 FL=1
MIDHTFEPVVVWETFLRRRTLTDAGVAARWLLERWPRETVKPRSYGRALRACLSAMEGAVPPAAARLALVKAVDDAGILSQA